MTLVDQIKSLATRLAGEFKAIRQDVSSGAALSATGIEAALGYVPADDAALGDIAEALDTINGESA